MQGLTGLAVVDLTGGSRDSPPLQAKEGETYPVIRSRPSLLVRMDQAVSTLLTNLNLIATDLHDLISPESRTSFKQLLTNLAHLSEALAAPNSRLDQLLASAGRTLENTERVSAQLPTLIARMADSTAALQGMAQEIARTSQAVNTVLDENRENVDHFTRQTLTEIGLLVTELRQLTLSLQRFAQQLEQEPNSLLVGGRPLPPGPGE